MNLRIATSAVSAELFNIPVRLPVDPLAPENDMETSLDPRANSRLIHFLQEELAISAPSIAMAMRRSEQESGPLPMVLWQYGLVSLEQLNRIFDWLEM